MQRRKLRKLRNNPKLFLKDYLKNRKNKLLNFFHKKFPKAIGVEKQITIICAVYNVEKYINDFVKSVVEQRLDFETNINIFFVDDGSPDNSKEVIYQWIKKYPLNIFYFSKENGGQASARNLGIENLTTPWVTFIDPDDFLDPNYFYLMNKYLDDKSTGALITKFKLYKEKFGTYHDGFQTDYCFTEAVRKVSSTDLQDCVQFSSSSTVYRTAVIKNNNLLFDERLTASFEDTKFFYEYISLLEESNIYYLRDSIYFYRLRANESSSSNSQWKKKAKYKEFFSYGLLSVIENFLKKNGTLPVYIQRLVLFSIIPYLQVASINKKRITDVLNKSEIDELLSNISKCLDHVDIKTIEGFYNSPGNYFWNTAILKFFKRENNSDKRVYINKVDIDENIINFRFYGKDSEDFFKFLVDGAFASPLEVKTISHDLFDQTLINEFNVSYQVPIGSSIEAYIDGCLAKIISDFKIIKPEDTDIYDGYLRKNKNLNRCAVFIDSGYKADDNAEHLYRSWKLKNGDLIGIDSYYVLDSNSPHWERLKNDGFKLVDINSLNAIKILKNSLYIFASYLPGHYMEWVKGHNFKFQKFIFLQHGVITSNLSKPLNAFYSQMNKIIISTVFERNEMQRKEFNYIFNKRDLICASIPRRETLHENSKCALKNKKKFNYKKLKTILICPTWRSSLDQININLNNYEDILFNSEYMKNWIGLLSSEVLKNSGEAKYIFCPHPNFYNLLATNGLWDKFSYLVSGNVFILNPKEVSYQKLFLEADLLITDYSSLHFDFASLRKPVFYFQFDYEEFYGNTHAYSKGIFDFEKNGFGPVLKSLEEICDILKFSVNKRINLFEKFYQRIDEAFLIPPEKISQKIKEVVFK